MMGRFIAIPSWRGGTRLQSLIGNATVMWQTPQNSPARFIFISKCFVVFFWMLKISGWQLLHSSHAVWLLCGKIAGGTRSHSASSNSVFS